MEGKSAHMHTLEEGTSRERFETPLSPWHSCHYGFLSCICTHSGDSVLLYLEQRWSAHTHSGGLPRERSRVTVAPLSHLTVGYLRFLKRCACRCCRMAIVHSEDEQWSIAKALKVLKGPRAPVLAPAVTFWEGPN